MQDDDRLREERKKAKKNKDKYVGISSEYGGGFGNFNRSSTFNDFNSSSSTSSTSNRTSSFASKSNALDNKDWRSSNPTFQERISDMTSKVKEIIDKATDQDAGHENYSDDEGGHSKNSKSDRYNNDDFFEAAEPPRRTTNEFSENKFTKVTNGH